MFAFKAAHLIQYPTKKYGWVGAVPASLMDAHQPTISDIFGGRVQADGLAYSGRAYATPAEALADAKAARVALCATPECACRKLF